MVLAAAYKRRKLPPGPSTVPFFGNLGLLNKSLFDMKPMLRELHSKYGPIISFQIGRRTQVFISDQAVAHKALVQNGAVFSDRPPSLEWHRIITSNQHNINSAKYGPLWRLLRRNLMSETLHSSRIKAFSPARDWVLKLLIERLQVHTGSGEPVIVVNVFQNAMFCLLVLMCFGQKLDEATVRSIETIHRRLLFTMSKFNIFILLPILGRILRRKEWNQLLQLRREQEDLLIPIINARKNYKPEGNNNGNTIDYCYVDSLLTLEIADEGGRKLTEGELVSLCQEFLNAGTDTTTTALQWIMANLVKHQNIQEKLVEEIGSVVGKEVKEVKEDDLSKMPYLKAVVMEGLRRHPPGHFLVPHAVSEEVTIEGYTIPKDATINFMVAEMGRDEKVWGEGTMEFRPERFLEGGEKVDITGSREIKMMPFGAGRRICPGLNLAMMHLEYFVANLVREFEWKSVEGEVVDLSEKNEFTVVMEKPLRVWISRRWRSP